MVMEIKEGLGLLSLVFTLMWRGLDDEYKTKRSNYFG